MIINKKGVLVMSETQFNNPAKSAPNKGAGRSRKKVKKEKKDRLALILTILQALVSVIFIVTLVAIDLLPWKYLCVVVLMVAILFLVTFTMLKRKKGRAIGRKILSIILILAFAIGSYYIGKVNGAMGTVTGGSYKIDNMVVAVLKDDPAETLEDARDYTFGVQYKLGGKDVRNVINLINEELETEINIVEYADMQEQAAALQDGTVKAIIYNEGYTGLLEEAFEGYSENIRIIYNYQIKTELEPVNVETDKDFVITEDCFNVYISGIDVYGPISTNSRSDVNIIATVNPKTHQILLTTTPRDYYVVIPGVSNGQKDKLTHAGIYGVDASMATLENLYETDIQFYARVNFTSVIEIVDQLGGVDVYSEYAFQNQDVTVKQGMNHFSGKEALAFARERYQLPSGDNQRGKNQQAVIVAIIKKMISPQMLMNAGGIIDSVSGNIQTNMSEDQIQELIKMQLREGGAWKIYSVAATGTGDNNYTYSMPNFSAYVMNPNQDSVNQIIEAMNRVENGEILDGSEIAQ